MNIIEENSNEKLQILEQDCNMMQEEFHIGNT
jgi:hypothetical protein